MRAKTKMLDKQRGRVQLQQQDGQTANATQTFLQYIEEASTFREAAPLKDRISYIFHMFDEDKDGKLGRSDLRKVLNPKPWPCVSPMPRSNSGLGDRCGVHGGHARLGARGHGGAPGPLRYPPEPRFLRGADPWSGGGVKPPR